MDKYQVYHYFKHYQSDFTELYWACAGLAVIFVCSVAIPFYLQYHSANEITVSQIADENYVQWHLEQEIKQIKAKAKKKRSKRKRGSLSTEENEA